MTGIFSTISGQFGKAWILGAMLPVALFTVFGLIIVQPMLPESWQVFGTHDELDFTNLVAGTVWIILASGLLFHLNGPLVRFYEGYPWQYGWIGRRRTKRYQTQFRAMNARWRGMRTLIRKIGRNHRGYSVIQREWKAIGLGRMATMPADEHLVLPTRLGNVIRAFEDYPRRQYGMDSIALWQHLLAVIDQDKAANIADRKVAFDFMLNFSFLLKVLGYLTLVAGIYSYLIADAADAPFWLWFLELAALAAFAYIFYRGAVNQAVGWGSAVRAAFEVNRAAILEGLEFRTPSPSLAADRERWGMISQQILFGDDPVGFASTYRGETFATEDRLSLALNVTRSVKPPANQQGATVVLSVTNPDARDAANVRVCDTIPEGYDYECDSATIGDSPVQVTGLNPYTFSVGDIKPGGEATLTYRLVKRG